MSLTLGPLRLAELLADVPLDRPAYRSIADAVRRLIADGRLPRGARMPSERRLAPALAVSRTTVTSAYAALRDSGYLSSRQGSGWVISVPEGRIRRGVGGLFPVPVSDGVIDLTCASTRASEGVVEAFEDAVARLPEFLASSGYLTLGLPELRCAVAARYSERGLPTDPEQILVTSGAVAAVQVITRALLSRRDRALTETPTFPNTIKALRRNGLRVTGVPLTPSGWDPSAMVATARATGAKVALVLPDFQNPTGLLMPDEMRSELVGQLLRAGVTLVSDETIAELDLADPTGASPRALPLAAHGANVLSVGSASKSHWGGLRIGWIRANRELVPALVEARVLSDPGAPVVEQLALARLLEQAAGVSEVRRAGLARARDALAGQLRTHLPELGFVLPRGGLSLWVELPSGSAISLAERAEEHGLLFAPGPLFAVDGGYDRWLRLPYVLPESLGEEAIRRLAAAYRESSHLQRGRDAGARGKGSLDHPDGPSPGSGRHATGAPRIQRPLIA